MIAEHPFFVGLDGDALALVAGCATNVHFGAGEYLFHEDGPADRFLCFAAVGSSSRCPARVGV